MEILRHACSVEGASLYKGVDQADSLASPPNKKPSTLETVTPTAALNLRD
jgi:hypothetical protein